jgi:hypothetical protein
MDNMFNELICIPLTFLTWTLYLYLIHRVLHDFGDKIFPFAYAAHLDHHKYINKHKGTSWHWNNLFLFNDTWLSTADLWITEVVPTLLFSCITGQWWISIFYYFWAALIQEVVEHNPKFDIYPWLTSGKWHLEHHWNTKVNYGLFIPVWDIVFDSHKKH